MKWTRERPGVYVAGPYRVEQAGTGDWWTTGPGVAGEDFGTPFLTKADAQSTAYEVALFRTRPAVGTVPVLGDIVETTAHPVRRGQIAAIMRQPVGAEHVEQPLYCLHLARGKRVCLFRDEIRVIVP